MGELRFHWRQWQHPGMNGMPGIKAIEGLLELMVCPIIRAIVAGKKRSWRKRTTRTLSAKSGPSGPAGDISIPRYPVRLGLIYLFTFFISIFLFADDFHRCDDDDVSPFRLLFAYFRRRMVPLKKRYPQSIEMVVRVVYAFPHSFRVV